MRINQNNICSLLRYCLYTLITISIFAFTGAHQHEIYADKVLSNTFISIVKNSQTSVVNIRTTKVLNQNTQKRGLLIKSQGSGIIYNKMGYIVTSKFVLQNAGEIIARLHNGSEYKAEVVGVDTRSGTAVLKINAENLTPAVFGNSDTTELGEIVLAIGSPLGRGQTVTSGIISAKGTSDIQTTGFEDFIQTDATIYPDCYGGPLINLKGEAVGISTAPPKQAGGIFDINLAIPINVARKATEDLIKYGRITRGWLGVTTQPITPQLQEALELKNNFGALVSDVEPDSSAAHAGIKSGDVIIKYNDKNIKNLLHLRSLVKRTEINSKVKMTVIRDGKELTLSALMLESSRSETKNRSDFFLNLGMVVQNFSSKQSINLGYEGEQGIMITEVIEGSPAFKAGLTNGDLIIEVQHKPVTNIDELYQAIQKIEQGEDILMFIRRQNKTSQFIVLKQKKEM